MQHHSVADYKKMKSFLIQLMHHVYMQSCSVALLPLARLLQIAYVTVRRSENSMLNLLISVAKPPALLEYSSLPVELSSAMVSMILSYASNTLSIVPVLTVHLVGHKGRMAETNCPLSTCIFSNVTRLLGEYFISATTSLTKSMESRISFTLRHGSCRLRLKQWTKQCMLIAYGTLF